MDNRRKKLVFRSWHRGTKEMDILLGNFAKKEMQDMSDEQVDAYEALLDVDDLDVYNWIIGKGEPPANAPYVEIIDSIKKLSHHLKR